MLNSISVSSVNGKSFYRISIFDSQENNEKKRMENSMVGDNKSPHGEEKKKKNSNLIDGACDDPTRKWVLVGSTALDSSSSQLDQIKKEKKAEFTN